MSDSISRGMSPSRARAARVVLGLFWILSSEISSAAPWAQGEAQDDPPKPAVEAQYQSPRALLEFVLDASVLPAGFPRAAFDPALFKGQAVTTNLERTKRLVRDLRELLEKNNYEPDLDQLPAAADALTTQGVWSYAHRRTIMGQELTLYELGFQRDAAGAWHIDAATVGRVEGEYQKYLDRAGPLFGLVPAFLQHEVLLLEYWQWIGLGLLVFLAVVVDHLARFLTRRVVIRVLGKAPISVDVDLKIFVRPVGVFVAALLFRTAVALLELNVAVHGVIIVATGVVLTVAGVWASYRLVDVFCGVLADRAEATEHKFDDMLVPLLRRTLKIFVVVFALVYVASLLTEEFWSVVAGLSIGTAAVAFAGKDSIENLFGTFAVLLDKPFQLGDWITMGEVDGSVEEVGFRSTRVRTFYNSVITVPNRSFISNHVDNMGARRYRRIKATLGLTYDTPPEKVEAFCEGVRELIRTHPFTRKDYYHVYMTGLGDSALEIMLYCFVEVPDWATELREKHRMFTDILRLASELNVEFAFPTQSLHLVPEGAGQHADRPADVAEGLRRGRGTARSIAKAGLADLSGGAPPPPGFDGADPDWRVPGGDSEDG